MAHLSTWHPHLPAFKLAGFRNPPGAEKTPATGSLQASRRIGYMLIRQHRTAIDTLAAGTNSRVWSLTLSPLEQDVTGLLSSKLWDLGTTGIEETADGLCAYFEHPVDPESIRRFFPDCRVTINRDISPILFKEARDRDPVLVGERFVIVPADRIVLPIDAAMAFGSGRHESTQLCLQALEQHLHSGQIVVDVGCGSGILALASRKLGAALVVAADIDEPAIAIARRHFFGPLFVGSADCLPNQIADLVICNITGKVNDHLALDLRRITKQTGRLVLSGFTRETAPRNFQPEQIAALRLAGSAGSVIQLSFK